MTGRTTDDWLFLSNHGTVLLLVAGDPTISIGEIEQCVGFEERAVQVVLEDLVAEGYVVEQNEAATATEMRSTARRAYGTRCSTTWRSGHWSTRYEEVRAEPAPWRPGVASVTLVVTKALFPGLLLSSGGRI